MAESFAHKWTGFPGCMDADLCQLLVFQVSRFSKDYPKAAVEWQYCCWSCPSGCEADQQSASELRISNLRGIGDWNGPHSPIWWSFTCFSSIHFVLQVSVRCHFAHVRTGARVMAGFARWPPAFSWNWMASRFRQQDWDWRAPLSQSLFSSDHTGASCKCLWPIAGSQPKTTASSSCRKHFLGAAKMIDFARFRSSFESCMASREWQHRLIGGSVIRRIGFADRQRTVGLCAWWSRFWLSSCGWLYNLKDVHCIDRTLAFRYRVNHSRKCYYGPDSSSWLYSWDRGFGSLLHNLWWIWDPAWWSRNVNDSTLSNQAVDLPAWHSVLGAVIFWEQVCPFCWPSSRSDSDAPGRRSWRRPWFGWTSCSSWATWPPNENCAWFY